MVEPPAFLAIRQQHGEQVIGVLAAKKVRLVRCRVVCVARAEHHALDTDIHHLIKETPNGIGICAIKERRIGRDPEPHVHGGLDTCDRFVIRSIAADRKVMFGSSPIQVHRKREVLGGLEPSCFKFLLEQDGIGAQVDVLLSLDQFLHQLANMLIYQRLATRDGHHRGAAFIDGAERIFQGHILAKNVGWVLNFPTASTGQIAAK